ncbi:MAG: hypothetical protein M8357_15985 [Desulfobulbaceae bacterium]|nr:hypothetical protein [Desulfobulbaceae bacterium]
MYRNADNIYLFSACQELAENELRRIREQQAEAERKKGASQKRAEQQLREQQKGKVKADDKPKRKKGY